MASPAFVYAFDNFGPDRFVELCGLLFGSRYKGFLLTGPGADGGVDGENEPVLGELRPDSPSLPLDTIVRPSGLTVFQFKHKVVARIGEAQARSQLLNLYRSKNSRKSEVQSELVVSRKPDTYVLVTNVEINSQFRESFRQICATENPEIANYLVVGLDDLQAWVTLDRHLRAQFFPTIFERPRFNLSLRMQTGFTLHTTSNSLPATYAPKDRILVVSVMNTGEVTSYIDNIKFKVLINGKVRYLLPAPLPSGYDPLANPKLGEPLEPGRSYTFRYSFVMTP
jgi:hypothetical protein